MSEPTAPHLSLLSTGSPGDPLLTRLIPWLERATQIDILASFTMPSGVALLADRLESALLRGAHLRLITSDYLHITHPRALTALLDLQDFAAEHEGSLHTRLVLSHTIPSSFHPKAWLLRDANNQGIAFVGSSNLSRAALLDGIEWNLFVAAERDPHTFTSIERAFEALWHKAAPLTHPWLKRYAIAHAQHSPRQNHPDPHDTSPPPPHTIPAPRPAQRDALLAIREHRARGHDRALIVMATGLGKTWLAAFDSAQWAEEHHIDTPRILFIAHRNELLQQAAHTFRKIYPEAHMTWCVGGRQDVSGDLVLASVQKLSRYEGLHTLERFDYVVLDEVHHAHAPSYRRLLRELSAGFWLGLTATPERTDGVHVRELFGGHVPYSAGLHEGIGQGALAPFRYVGLKDTIDYKALPWRDGGFDPEALEVAAQTDERMERVADALDAHAGHAGHRTLIFCCTKRHARFVADWLERERGWRVAVVHSGAGSDDRVGSVTRLEAGELSAICVVDVFNEGVDIPTVDRVVFLRPTESAIVFVQQLGRGLRAAPGKRELVVMDLVGNHQSFLSRLQKLLDLSATRAVDLHVLRAALSSERGMTAQVLGLPAGCTLELDLEVIELLRELLPSERDGVVARAYRELMVRGEERPVAAELALRGYSLGSLRAQGGWLQMLATEGVLTWEEREVLRAHGRWFEGLESGAYERAVIDAMLGKLATHSEAATTEVFGRLVRELVDYHEARAFLKHYEGKRETLGEWVGGRLEREGESGELVLRSEEAPGGMGCVYARALWDHTVLRLEHDAREGVVRVRALSGVRTAQETLEGLCCSAGAGDEREVRLTLRAAPDGVWLEVAADEDDAGGEPRRGSRELSREYAERAGVMARAMWERLGEQVLEADGKKFQLKGVTRGGGLVVQPERGGRRSVTATDLGWVLHAEEEAKGCGVSHVDEPWVNALRYHTGTPRKATRWIDTGWALRALAVWRRSEAQREDVSPES